MRRAMIAVLGLCVASLMLGCASSEWNGYVGQSVETPSLRYGPPSSVYELSDGRRAYQWRLVNASTVISSESSTEISVGNTVISSSETECDPTSQECFYTLFAENRGGVWIATEFQQPRFECS